MQPKMIRLTIETSPEIKGYLSDFLLGIDAQGVTETDLGDDNVTITALFTMGTSIDSLRRDIRDFEYTARQIIPGLEGLKLDFEEIDHSQWDLWKKMLKTVRISNRIIIHPPWEQWYGKADEIVLEINPSLAFGTGHHETTRNCLISIQEICEKNKINTMIDVGCGSGILGIAAVKLGVSNVVAFDNDILAIAETRSNISRNGVADKFSSFCGTIDCIAGLKADIVAANISLLPIMEMKENLFRTVNQNGFLVLSGIPLSAKDEALDMVKQEKKSIADVKIDGDWLTLILGN